MNQNTIAYVLIALIASAGLVLGVMNTIQVQDLNESVSRTAQSNNLQPNEVSPTNLNSNGSPNNQLSQQGDIQNNGQNNGPASHQVYTATSEDGENWTVIGEVLDMASVPQSITLDDGTVRVFYVDASDQPENVNCADLNETYDTATVSDCIVNELPDGYKMVDPVIVRLGDGRYRLYFYQALIKGDVGSKEVHYIGSAISDDALEFTYEGTVFEYDGLVDPDVFWDGEQWRMYVFSLTDGETIVATSEDGLNFTYQEPLGIQKYGTTQPVQLDDGSYRMYAFVQGEEKNIVSFTATIFDEWELESEDVIQPTEGREITDPQVVQLVDGSWLMTYKESDLQTFQQNNLQNQPQ